MDEMQHRRVAMNRRVAKVDDTVGGRNPANQLRLVVYPSITGFHTCQVVQDFFHQQH